MELKIKNGPLQGRRFQVTEGGLRLGRSSYNDIHIPDEKLSRNHCLFEPHEEFGIKLTDLASSNGTFCNGRELGNDSVVLKMGDEVRVGDTIILVIDADKADAQDDIDLGLGEKPDDADFAAPRARRPMLFNVLVVAAAVVAIIAIYLVMKTPVDVEEGGPRSLPEVKPVLLGIEYEKVVANLDGIFRYALSVASNGEIVVELDDTSDNRHPTIPPRRLDEKAMATLAELLPMDAFRGLEDGYVGAEPEPQAYESWLLKVIYSTCTQEVSVINSIEPEAFRILRERLEAFSKNELGLHAIQYPRAKLVELAEEAVSIGDTKWEDRDVQNGNLYDSMKAYGEAIFYLDTVDPKPQCAQLAQQGKRRATEELERRYKEQRFLADRALNLGAWNEARRELLVLLEMIPDRYDARNREAAARLVDVEKRIKEAK